MFEQHLGDYTQYMSSESSTNSELSDSDLEDDITLKTSLYLSEEKAGTGNVI